MTEELRPLTCHRGSVAKLKRFRSVRGRYVSGDFFVILDNGDELVIPVHEGIELGAWLLSQGVQIALETAELSLDEQGRGIR